MKFAEYSDVQLTTDKYLHRGVSAGAIGTILEIWNDGEAYEVDFSDSEGTTIACFAVLEDELMAYSEGDQQD